MARPDTEEAPASRLPSTRESRPAMLGLALLLIVGGALASAYLALQSGDRADFLRVERELNLGAPISEGDLGTVSLPEGFEGGVPASDMDDLVGQYTTVPLLAETVLAPSMITESSGIPAGRAHMTLPLEAGEFVPDTKPGAQLVLTLERSDGQGTGYAIQGELVEVLASAAGGFTSTAGATSGAVVSVDDSCARILGPAIRDDEIKVDLLSAEPNSNSVKADCQGMG